MKNGRARVKSVERCGYIIWNYVNNHLILENNVWI